MKNKDARLEAIRSILATQAIGSQVELLKALEARGVSTIQATLSRDLKQLRVAKTTNAEGRHVYTLPSPRVFVQTYRPTQHVVELRFSGNLAVARTRPGHAASLAYIIDNQNYEGIIGTIAGDDTVLIVMAENASREKLKAFLDTLLPEA